MRSLLITGFGPFPGMPVNPSAALARRLAASPHLTRALGGAPRLRILTTAYGAIVSELTPALTEDPGAVLMIGVAGRSRQVRVEVRALNRASRLFPDASGRIAARLALDPEGPALRRAGAVAVKAGALLRRRGLPAGLSRDAGRYLCNASYFRALAQPVPVLFLHIPRPPRSGARAWEAGLAAAFAEVARLLALEGRRSGG
ncbi:peptidase C15 [Methylobacterium nodulans]|uniref:Pyroglutamyl-peptidase I n=1 Tax=Methylobacterium nodulans (strain LMG 21967 / CNCM I-2342 / ORS 2060) TaxID=460265 RepID=B8ID65_METNO|nr:peptidase C15 [Methylobacterium nodulans]ACL59457.1 peptidase C15 pyroglutamyl peptidase I [Methylobacterium nodulans ORS 2060]